MQPKQAATSRLENFRTLTPAERLARVAAATGLDHCARAALAAPNALSLERANGMIENVIGTFQLPLGIATNFLINGRDYLVPMAVEEPSIVAAASYMARIARSRGGFRAFAAAPVMRGQIQILGMADPFDARLSLLAARDELIAAANAKDPVLVKAGGGCRDIEVQLFPSSARGAMVVLHLLVDVRDAMGANIVNTMAESVSTIAERIAGGKARLRILSNLADLRLARACVEVSEEALATVDFSGRQVIEGILDAYEFAVIDPYRAATHNKGVMNGIDPVALATGNDWRAIEAGAHAYAARSGRYRPLTTWETNAQGHLIGVIELPMALGLIGGATQSHPTAQAALRILNVASAVELAEVTAAVGLAQNMAALRALATEGIQRGHMALHARNIAIAVGAAGDEIGILASRLAAGRDVHTRRAEEILSKMRRKV